MKHFYIRVAYLLAAALPLFAAAQSPRTTPNETGSVMGPMGNPASDEAAAKAAAVSSAKNVPGNMPLNSMAWFGVDYKIVPNDVVEVEVYGVPELKRSARINSAGMASFSLIGNVQLTGLTAQQAEDLIAKRYAEKYLQDPQVSVVIKEFTTRRVTIDGAVARPGIYPMTGQISLLQAIALAGGGAQYAELSEIMVFRPNDSGGKNVAVYDLEKIRAGEKPDPVIQPEDLVVVKRNAARAAVRDSLVRDIFDTINPFSIFTR